jgi:GH18 family chitinase
MRSYISYKWLLLFSLIVGVFPAYKEKNVMVQAAPHSSFKVIGYLPVGRRDLSGFLSNFDFSRITHLNLAFINPDSSGVFADIPVIPQVVRLAHRAGVKVLMSMGGGGIPVYFTGFLTDDKRAAFVQSIAATLDKYQLDGVDVDLEGNAIDQHYARFVSDLSSMVKARKKLLTAAVATPYGADTPDAALEKFDFINIMSYDKTGPWRPSNPGPHAPYDSAVSDLVYWGKTRSIPKSKMTLGLPFYGYGFGPGNMTSDMNFSTIAATYPAAVNDDQVALPDGETMYYNGITTIRKKTALAMQETSGIMIWELLQDAQGPVSLLKNIHEVLDGK